MSTIELSDLAIMGTVKRWPPLAVTSFSRKAAIFSGIFLNAAVDA